jgi:hypothetical protein
MAKYPIIASNGDGSSLLLPTASINYDNDNKYLTATNISASNLILSGANNAVISVSGGVFIPYNAASYSGSYITSDGVSWRPALQPLVSAGTASGDLTGSYPNPTVRSISNVNTGSLKVANGGLSGSGQANILSSIPSGSLIIANGTGNIIQVSTSSYDGVGDWILGATNAGTTWGATRATAATKDQNVQYFTCPVANTTAVHTWTKANSNHKWARLLIQAGGGAGAAGGLVSASPSTDATAGGAGGGFTDTTVYLGNISTATVTVGAGGIAATTFVYNTYAPPGTPSSFSATGLFFSAEGGRGANTAASSTLLIATSGKGMTFNGGSGSIGRSAVAGPGAPSAGASGGGMGGVSAPINGSAGGTSGVGTTNTAGVALSHGSFAPNLFGYTLPLGFGTGGSGGAFPGGWGYNGVFGGGGGGSAKASPTSWPVRGGNGGDGFVVVISY